MKRLIPILTTCLVVSLLSCQREATVQQVMDNEAQRREVYSMIMENPELHKEMMQVMQEHKMDGMMGEGMMGKDHHMMGGDSAMHMKGGMDHSKMQGMMQQMMAACAKDSANCNMMAKMMMNNRPMMMQMMQQMQKGGMMDDACLQRMKQKMPQ